VEISAGIADDLWRVHQVFPGHSGSLSLAIPRCIDVMSTGGGYGHRWAGKKRRILRSCRTAGILGEVG